MVKVADLPSFDMAESLKTEEDIVMYLNMVLEENDPAELAHALSVIAKARVMTLKLLNRQVLDIKHFVMALHLVLIRSIV